MQTSTGCKINVSQASGADIEREIQLVGTPQAIEAAKKAIWDKVDSVVCASTTSKTFANQFQKEKNGGAYGNRRGGGRDNSNQDNYPQQQQQASFGQHQQSHPPAQANAPQQGDAAADPYAIYGGYQNYLAMWYSSFAQQQAQQNPGAGGQGPPGAA
jgi:far upstream element-binding protein